MTATSSCTKALLLVALSAAAVSTADSQTHALVSVGDHRLDVVRGGAGGPAVVFETGLADSLDVWLPMWRTVAEYTTVVAYSRAGFGRSDPGPPDHSVPHAAADLYALLHRLPVKPPYVLVARSYGSLIARLYTSLHPTDVAGLVLVDGTHEQQVRRYGTIDSAYPRQFRVYYDSVLAHLAPGPEAAEIRETVRIQALGTVPGLAPLPDVPIAVLTSMRSDESAPYVNGTARGHEVWRALHDEWFRRSRNGIHIETARSGHGIQDDEPALVAMAIRFVLDRVRAPSGADSGATLEAELRAADRARGEALRAGDTAALARLYADDFVMITSTGQLRTKADQLRDIGAGAIGHQGPPERILKLARYGDVAVVQSESDAGTLVAGGRPDPHARRYTRVYVRRDGRWQLLATHMSVVADSVGRP